MGVKKNPKAAVKKPLLGLLAGLIGASVAILFFLPGWLDVWEAKTWDWRVNAMAKPAPTTDKIRLILLDQNSLDWAKEESGLGWPWPREVYSAIIQRESSRLRCDLLGTLQIRRGR
jgi:CHASE2 domain-containing sensor protein